MESYLFLLGSLFSFLVFSPLPHSVGLFPVLSDNTVHYDTDADTLALPALLLSPWTRTSSSFPFIAFSFIILSFLLFYLFSILPRSFFFFFFFFFFKISCGHVSLWRFAVECQSGTRHFWAVTVCRLLVFLFPLWCTLDFCTLLHSTCVVPTELVPFWYLPGFLQARLAQRPGRAQVGPLRIGQASCIFLYAQLAATNRDLLRLRSMVFRTSLLPSRECQCTLPLFMGMS